MKIETEWVELWQGSANFKNLPHKHDDWMQVTLPIKGICHFTREARNCGLEQGSGLLLPPGTQHHFHLGAQDSVIILKVHEKGIGNMAALEPQFGRRLEYEICQPFATEDIVGRFRHWMQTLLQGQSLADPLSVQEVEYDVIAYLGEWLGIEAKEAKPLISASSGKMDPHLQRALTFIQDCYKNTVSIDQLAVIAHQSRFHFIRSFRDATGTTPYQYVLKLRITEAMNRLRSTEATIGQISAELGFSSPSQFHRAFRKLTGSTPQAYRHH
ncbi:AraC family transcriptional regulator [Gorillibacterium massiliense]|uniref:AraC family transcriptional regulator n=1 Tax=Gorillibacterium massiliense TaxID=1280390 RepID=UPI00138E1C7A|nr:helix-turn-helix domain-containing protein [Gorillibacterium massiliense]